MQEQTIAQEFFDTYTSALLARDEAALSELYAVPALIEFPDQPVAVSDPAQTAAFFREAFGPYEGVTKSTASVRVVAATGHSIWADVTWTHDAAPRERLMYQLVRAQEAWQIAVLTPLEG